MKKEIVINASKDRSRIAIVESGQLSELYIENPDNVRTIGNIYLARIRKLMPAIRAAFVDIGQKQDAFLHYSDLTENLAGLLAIAGESVPGVAPTVASAPGKRVGDDESEPPVSESLDLGEDDPPPPIRTRGRRPSRPRGGTSGPRRSEEEEEQEEPTEGARRRLPHVIDLTRRTGRVEPPRPAPAPPPVAEVTPAPIEEVAPAPAVEPEEAEVAVAAVAAPPRRRASRSRAAAATTEDGPPDATAETAEAETVEPAAPKPRRSRAKKPAAAAVPEGEATEEAPAPARRSRSRKVAAPAAEPVLEAEAAATSELVEADEMPALEEVEALAPVVVGEAEMETEGEGDTEAEGDEAGPARRRRRGRRGGRRRRRSGAGAAEGADETDEAGEDEEPAAADETAAEVAEPAPPRAPRPPRERPAPERPVEAAEPERPEAAPAARVPRVVRAAPAGGRPEELLRRDGRILVKVIKEPISAKGSRVSTDVSLAGRFLVLVPAADYVAVSKKIESAKERRRLRSLADSLRPEGFGVIVRTVADGRDAKAIDTDLRLLVDKWRKIEQQLAGRPEPPVTLYQDVSMVSSIVRDLFTDDYDRILVDDPKVHRNLKAYIAAVAPHMAERVVLHRSNTPVFRAAGIERQVEEAFSSRVSLPTGGYLVIEHTEAMHVIDVNSGRAGRGLSQSENLLRVNMEAAREVARQLRLRDLGGIIVVDFIDMYAESDRKKVYAALKEEFRKDRAVTKLLPMSDFGIIEITRQRLRPSLTQKADRLSDDAPGGDGSEVAVRMAAVGAGEIAQPERRYEPERRDRAVAPEEVAATLDGWLRHYRATVPEKYRDRPITLLAHPLLMAFLRRGFPSRITRWRFAMRGVPFAIEEDATLDPLAFVIRDDKSGKTITSKYSPG